jgi:hypothetical protein
MTMSRGEPRPPKPSPPPKPWRREKGRYRTADDRFTIESGGAGRWFLTDERSLDELGLARTLGPFATLDAAKDAAAARREQASDESPLTERLAERLAAARVAGPAGSEAKRDPRTGAKRDPRTGTKPDAEPVPAPRTWLDELAEHDPAAAARARRLIAQLRELAIDDADGIVRRDVLAGQPAVAATLLARELATALLDVLDRAPGPGVPTIAREVLAATLDVVSGRERATGAGRDLPGWRLVERPPDGRGETTARRLIVSEEDVPGR